MAAARAAKARSCVMISNIASIVLHVTPVPSLADSFGVVIHDCQKLIIRVNARSKELQPPQL
jgi:hypothetical protein